MIKQCIICGAEFDGRNAAKFCPACTKATTSPTRKTTVKRGDVMKCEVCGREIIRRAYNQRYCADCHELVRKRQALGSQRRIREAVGMKKCVICGAQFEPAKFQPNQKYCSERCRNCGQYLRNRDKILEHRRAYRQAHCDEINARHRAYYAEHKDERKVRRMKRAINGGGRNENHQGRSDGA